MIRVDLVARLKDTTEVTDIIGNKLYHLSKPQNIEAPYAIYRVISSPDEQCLGGGIYSTDYRFQIDIYSKRSSELVNLGYAIRNALIGFKASNSFSINDGFDNESDLKRQIIDFKLKER